ncbi:hypothetical protein [Microbacterium sp. 18062]|uniref:hypothetical protein n=1 Tax=Microbacterium sp. 18062 TaxID=2681410 RepID=UPI0013578C6D|nr:hypothetical protein [Microbacterium sp. 18062]
MTAPPRAAAALSAVLVSALALTACGAQPHPAPSATTLPSGVVATLLPATPAQTADQARVWITNGTESDLALTRLRIDAPVFAGIGRKTVSGTVEVDAGRSAEIVVTLPPIDCTVGDDTETPVATPGATTSPDADPTPGATASPDETTATIGFALGAAIGVAVETLDDPQGVIAARAAAACG